DPRNPGAEPGNRAGIGGVRQGDRGVFSRPALVGTTAAAARGSSASGRGRGTVAGCRAVAGTVRRGAQGGDATGGGKPRGCGLGGRNWQTIRARRSRPSRRIARNMALALPRPRRRLRSTSGGAAAAPEPPIPLLIRADLVGLIDSSSGTCKHKLAASK